MDFFTTFTIFDGVLLLILAIGVILGIWRGFFEIITKPLKLIAAACLTFVFSNPIIAAWTRPLFTGFAYDWIYNAILEKIPEASTATTDSAPLIIRILAALFGVGTGENGETTIESFSTALAAPVGNLIATVVTYLAVFLIIFIILSILIAIIGTAFDSGPLKVLDKSLGVLLGVALAIVISCLVANIASWIAPTFSGGYIYNFFKDFDPFSLILSI